MSDNDDDSESVLFFHSMYKNHFADGRMMAGEMHWTRCFI